MRPQREGALFIVYGEQRMTCLVCMMRDALPTCASFHLPWVLMQPHMKLTLIHHVGQDAPPRRTNLLAPALVSSPLVMGGWPFRVIAEDALRTCSRADRPEASIVTRSHDP